MYSILKKQFTEDWVERLGPFLFTEEFKKTLKTLVYFNRTNQMFPPIDKVFRIFRAIKPDEVKVIMVGQDPYKKRGEATGIAMGLEDLPYITPTLNTMFDEIERDLGYRPLDVSLLRWVEQGVMLTNTALTVGVGASGSHLDLWRPFTRNFFLRMGKKRGLVYVFLGKKAQEFIKYVDTFHNTIITAAHPAADSYSNTKIFYGNDLFTKINKSLEGCKIKW